MRTQPSGVISAALASGLRKYPRVTLSPRISTCPTWPGADSAPASSSSRTSQYGIGRPSQASASAVGSVAGTCFAAMPTPSERRSTVMCFIGARGSGNVTASEASAMPYTVNIEPRARPYGAIRSRNSFASSIEIGSAPLKISFRLDRSTPSSVLSPSAFSRWR